MGHYLNLKPTKEAIEELKKSTWMNEDSIQSMLNESRHQILVLCLLNNTLEDIHKVERSLKFYLEAIKNVLNGDAVLSAVNRYNEEKGELYYCGLEYTNWEENIYSKEELSNTIQRVIEKLLILAIVVKTPDYFGDSERFYEKWNEINEEVDDFIEVISKQMNYQIISQLKEFIEKNEESEEELND